MKDREPVETCIRWFTPMHKPAYYSVRVDPYPSERADTLEDARKIRSRLWAQKTEDKNAAKAYRGKYGDNTPGIRGWGGIHNV